VVAKLLTVDVIASLVPGVATQRGEALAQSWGAASEKALGKNILERPFEALWEKDDRWRVPSLLLSSTRVESGTRAIAAGRMRFAGGGGSPFYEAWDQQFDRVTPLTLGAAVLDSARFPYVSPVGRLEAPGIGLWGHVVDGGYLDNSGGLAIDEMLGILMAYCKRVGLGDSVRPVVLYLKNGYDGLPDIGGRDTYPPHQGLVDLQAPLLTLEKVRQFHSKITINKLMTHVESNGGELLDIRLGWANVPIPLGWTLSPEAFKAIDQQVSGPWGGGLDKVKRAMSAVARPRGNPW
jgi:hypothetical protein